MMWKKIMMRTTCNHFALLELKALLFADNSSARCCRRRIWAGISGESIDGEELNWLVVLDFVFVDWSSSGLSIPKISRKKRKWERISFHTTNHPASTFVLGFAEYLNTSWKSYLPTMIKSRTITTASNTRMSVPKISNAPISAILFQPSSGHESSAIDILPTSKDH